MSDHEKFGMEVQAVSLGAVKFISDNGRSESVSVGTMQAQLMRASRLGRKGKARGGAVRGFVLAKYLEMRHGRFAVLVINHLARTV